ncbi:MULTISPECIES: 5-formyltetrahydrofolate cyclo-ligase [Tenacibaculum]|uniref:5-formyltetrahydrofolate cyclo-ligase n=1 Tax=Tenacibaculum TaxID=104267 RepID=UPI001F0A3F0D|nr:MULTISPECIES: 5-formyltetrahydrofolate cyclo-ligase [Tenacibaculum]MCH3880950.1 5-formyltetrahydrofolate cyclo-ligase [Tenacibaculum aquimarinum]MCH3884174.1 5-formyltetrahydrofolate cyclo-ligase [Tenacibaculum aquimarinum]MDO6599450.1 5-formyltetrahydrofolate cyclo-ligase [Tenacibaculum sp. 1_MG-2023]
MNKTVLRKLYKQRRKDLSTLEVETLQEKIYQQVFALDFSTINTIHIFLSIERLLELNTNPIIDFLLLNNKQVVVSVSDFETNTLKHFLFDRKTKLKVSSFGIPEPINGKEIDAKEIDLVFVPLLISDEKNYRVGYGKGFYDRFLSECRKDVKTIGLNFFKPIQTITNLNEFDIPLQKIIYPK